MSLPIEEIRKKISDAYLFYFGEDAQMEKLAPAGSDRLYFKVQSNKGTQVATYGENRKENQTFAYFCQHFFGKGLAVPELYWIGDELYFQEFLGNTSLLDVLENEGLSPHVFELYKQSLSRLARLQVQGHTGLDYSQCLTNREFGRQAILADLLYFKYYFLDTLGKAYDKQKLIDEFEHFATLLAEQGLRYFMFRDFQSRNIMVTPDGPRFIDFQGGMMGAPQYDAASLLWQAKANLPDEWKEGLLTHYMESLFSEIGGGIDAGLFRRHYNGYVLIRLLQVLGAYGFRGLFERKAHFLTSIPLALSNLKSFLNQNPVQENFSEFNKVLGFCLREEVIKKFTPIQANAQTPLTVTVNSFSFKKGIPPDNSANGGGFVFDMRGILNPGRVEEYKKLSGMDKPVIDFLEQRTEMPDFMNGVYSLVDVNVANYLERDFESLMVNFGCTGGQHRSVYAAEALARHLRNKFKVRVQLHHLNKENWVR